MSLFRASIVAVAVTALVTGTANTLPAAAAPPAAAVAAALPAHLTDAGAHDRVRFTVGTHNVEHASGQLTGFADVIGWQELDRPVGWAAARNLPGYHSYLPESDPAKEDTISWNASQFELVSEHTELTHPGEAKVTPNRYVNWVVLRHLGSGLTFAFVNTHFISGAWNKHPDRQQRWLHHQQVLQQVVAGIQAQNLPVIVVGDMNRPTSLGLDGTERIPVGTGDSTPIDQLYVTRGAAVGQADRLAMFGSDHHAYRATVAFPAPVAIAVPEQPPTSQPPTSQPPTNPPPTNQPPTSAPTAEFLALLARLVALLQSLQGTHG